MNQAWPDNRQPQERESACCAQLRERYERRLEKKDREIELGRRREEKMNARLEMLQGVGGTNGTLARQGRRIRKLEARAAELTAEVRKLKAQRQRAKQHRFGRSSERAAPKSKRKRGAQPGSPGRRRTPRGNLPTVESRHGFDEAPRCADCGARYGFHGTVDSEVKEVEVKAHVRRQRRDRWRRQCDCETQPAAVTAKAPAPLFDGGEYGTTVWAHYVSQRFAQGRTLGSVSRWFESVGMPISKGTLCGHDARLLDLFAPVSEAIRRHQAESGCIQMDETSWPVQESASPKRWAWCCVTADAARFRIASSRSAAAGLSLLPDGVSGAVLVSDRLNAYPAIAAKRKMVAAYCWAHSRRDFLDAARGEPQLERWAQAWVKRFRAVYKANALRMRHFDDDLGYDAQGDLFKAADERLRREVSALFDAARRQIRGIGAENAKFTPLNRLIKYESQMRVFIKRPRVPLDNNASERSLRALVIMRKLSFGSKTDSAAALAACLHSVFETLRMNGVEPHGWIESYLAACAESRGAPPDAESFLPWGGWPRAP